jgi:O-methyltransferase involved in polyketide biosynthesis
MDLSPVSRTAILLLICRAVAAERDRSAFADPMAELCLDRLLACSSARDRQWIDRHKRLYAGIQGRDAISGARRGRVFDARANDFIAGHPGCTVINLACGFDTRFWRIENQNCRYIEIDLPEVIQLKKELLKDHLAYTLLGISVTDRAWIDQVTLHGNTDFLLIAEGLFMWFSPGEAARVLREIAARFLRSQIILDMVPERFTRGFGKALIRLHSRLEWGLDVAWEFGIKHPRDLEAFAGGFKVIGAEKGTAGPIVTLTINAGG